jgi:hypothetical protein
MVRAFTVALCSSIMLLTIACTKGRYTEDHQYVGNPERPQATSESTMGDQKGGNPSDTQLRQGESP